MWSLGVEGFTVKIRFFGLFQVVDFGSRPNPEHFALTSEVTMDNHHQKNVGTHRLLYLFFVWGGASVRPVKLIMVCRADSAG